MVAGDEFFHSQMDYEQDITHNIEVVKPHEWGVTEDQIMANIDSPRMRGGTCKRCKSLANIVAVAKAALGREEANLTVTCHIKQFGTADMKTWQQEQSGGREIKHINNANCPLAHAIIARMNQ